MGCISTKPDINDKHPNIFQVSNMNDHGDLISPGQLQVTEMELVLYQRGKKTVWPLRSLRKYGFDTDIFSFECGRRCQTGEGIYAFRCRKAEQLFNIVQHFIVLRNTDEPLTAMSPSVDFPVPLASTGPPVQRRPLDRSPGSLTIEMQQPEHNNNKETVEPVSPNLENYANITTGMDQQRDHLYMNIDSVPVNPIDLEDTRHCYANVDSQDLELLRSVPATPTGVNYAELDLDDSKHCVGIVTANGGGVLSDPSPVAKKGYAIIDFERTNALSQSINPPMEVEESSRKTRHNSTISDVPVNSRHSNSLSDD